MFDSYFNNLHLPQKRKKKEKLITSSTILPHSQPLSRGFTRPPPSYYSTWLHHHRHLQTDHHHLLATKTQHTMPTLQSCGPHFFLCILQYYRFVLSLHLFFCMFLQSFTHKFAYLWGIFFFFWLFLKKGSGILKSKKVTLTPFDFSAQ